VELQIYTTFGAATVQKMDYSFGDFYDDEFYDGDTLLSIRKEGHKVPNRSVLLITKNQKKKLSRHNMNAHMADYHLPLALPDSSVSGANPTSYEKHHALKCVGESVTKNVPAVSTILDSMMVQALDVFETSTDIKAGHEVPNQLSVKLTKDRKKKLSRHNMNAHMADYHLPLALPDSSVSGANPTSYEKHHALKCVGESVTKNVPVDLIILNSEEVSEKVPRVAECLLELAGVLKKQRDNYEGPFTSYEIFIPSHWHHTWKVRR
jgi:hypothetical protein